MSTQPAAIRICVLLAGLWITGCAAGLPGTPAPTPPPSRTPYPTATTVPTSTASPPTPTPRSVTLYSEGVPIKTICLEVSQSYAKPARSTFKLPIYETVESYLSAAELEVAKRGGTCSGTLTFDVQGTPLGAQYTLQPGGGGPQTCYAGAATWASATFSALGNSPLTADSEIRTDPPGITSDCQTPEEAPYEWKPLYFRTVGNLWGPRYIYRIIETAPDAETAQVAGYALAYLSPDWQVALVQDLDHGNPAVRVWVARGLVGVLGLTYSGTSEYIEWNLRPERDSPDLIEAARAMSPTLLELLADDSRDVREAAAILLGMIGSDGKAAVPFIADALLLEEQRLKLEIEENCSAQKGCPYSFLLHDDFFLAGIWAIGRLEGAEAVPMLIELLRRQYEPPFPRLEKNGVNPSTAAIRVTLTAITGQDFGVDAGEWQRWWETQK